jgi:peptide deformylase
MTVWPIRLYGDPVLRHACPPVTDFGSSLRRLVADLRETCELPGRAGVAAPQIGVQRRVFSYRVDDQEGYVVNPVLVSCEGELEAHDESCLSIPGVWAPTPRWTRAVVRGVDMEGKPVEVEGTGLMARCLQHETDHLDGRLFIDRLHTDERRRVLKALRDGGT